MRDIVGVLTLHDVQVLVNQITVLVQFGIKPKALLKVRFSHEGIVRCAVICDCHYLALQNLIRSACGANYRWSATS